MRSTVQTSLVALAFASVAAAPTARAEDAPTVRLAAGPGTVAVQATVDQFRADLGNLNANSPGSAADGRREIDWDGVSNADAAPSRLPGDFFNRVSARGVVMSTASGSFQVSAAAVNPEGAGVRFQNLVPTYSTAFAAFSGQRIFIATGANEITVEFRTPASDTPAVSRGFGVVFTDVDTSGTAAITLYAGERRLGRWDATASGGNGAFSFVGVAYPTAIVSKVVVTCGSTAPAVEDLSQGATGADIVAMDDFIYGEPQEAADAQVATVPAARVRLADARTLIESAYEGDAAFGAKLLRLADRATAALADASPRVVTAKRDRKAIAGAVKAVAALERALRSRRAAQSVSPAELQAIFVKTAEVAADLLVLSRTSKG